VEKYNMAKKNRPHILVITPVSHIDGLMGKLSRIGDVTYTPDPTEKEVLKKMSGVNAIFTNPNKSKVYLGDKVISSSENLKVICTASTGRVHIDLQAAKNFNVKVLSLTKEYETIKKISSTADLAFTLMMASLRNLPEAIDSVRKGGWDYEKFIGKQLNQLNVGVIGYGRLGKIFSSYCHNFGAMVSVYDPHKTIKDINIKQVNSIEELVSQSDIISLHVHVTSETKRMFGRELLRLAKHDVTIVNTSRGEIVDEDSIVEFLKNNKRARYCTDVLSGEITSKRESPILLYFIEGGGYYQVIITPHIGGMTKDAQLIAYHRAADMLDVFLRDK
jgi:D-3-phosphoglycerate dehydrogenase / 2-oxoglutarate reductase